jgi:hypothetical protein
MPFLANASLASIPKTLGESQKISEKVILANVSSHQNWTFLKILA